MKKYISVEDSEKAWVAEGGLTLDSYESLKGSARPMIEVSDIEKILNNVYGDKNTINRKLKKLIKPEPKKYGGLTVDEWERLKKIKLIRVTLWFDAIAADSFLSDTQKISEITKLLPDPENFYRHHNGGECPLPDNVIVEKKAGTYTYTGKAKHTNWEADFSTVNFGYRVIGVADE